MGIKKWFEKHRQLFHKTSVEIKRRRDHNSSIPISMLPPEVLLIIVSLTGPSESKAYSDISSSIRICSQVCHAWRCLTLSNPLLWGLCFSGLHLQGSRWTQELLQRSGPHSPLSVAFWLSTKSQPASGAKRHSKSYRTNIELLAQRLPQIRNLQIGVDNEYELKDLEKAILPFNGPAPSLTSFTLLAPYKSYDDSSRYYFVLDPDVFGGRASPLQHLKLKNCGLNIRSPLYHQLTSLAIFYVGDDPRAPTAFEWLAVVKACKSLVSWSLEGFIAPTPQPLPDLQEVFLPSLTHLRLHLFFPDAIIFLSYLRFPSLRSFDVIVGGIEPRNEGYQTLSNILKNHIDAFLPTLKPSPWRISFLDNDSVRLMKEQTTDIIGRSTFSIQCGIWPDVDMPIVITSLLSILLPHGLVQAEQLTFHVHHPNNPKMPSSDRLIAALSPLTLVTTLRLAYYQAETRFFAARNSFWTPRCPGPMGNILDYPNSLFMTSSPFCFFPKLSYLFVQPITPFDTLERFITKRKEMGVSIRTVHFSDIDSDVFHKRSELPSEEQFERLGKLGPTIIMDKNIQEILATTDAAG